MNINTDLYRVFLAAAEAKSVSEAARRLYVTQPAVSNSLIQLENLLGVRLFIRENRGISLTAEGEILYENVRNAFRFLHTGEEKIRDMIELRGGVLRVGASDMTLRFYLLDYIEKWISRYPAVKLNITNAPTPQTVSALKSGHIDFGVISEPAGITDEDIIQIRVKHIKDVIVASNKYALGKDGSDVSLEQLSKNTLIMLERGTSTRRYIDSILPELRDPDIELATSDLILDFAKRSIGVAFIVEDFAEQALADGTLHKIKLDKFITGRNFLLIFSKKYPMSSAAKRFIADLGYSEYL